MRKKTLFRSGLLLALVLLLAIGGNAKASVDFPTYLPIIQKEPTPPKNTGKVSIPDIHFDGTGSSEPDEYVEIKNRDTFPIQLQNWTLRDEEDHIFTFPSFVILPGQICRVYTNEDHPEWCGFNFGSDSAIWGNIEDTAYLSDSNGKVILTYSYVVVGIPIP